jgi:hypothetical protein
MSEAPITSGTHMTPRDLVCGLGTADRNFLAFSLALFDDSTLSSRLARFYDESRERIEKLTGREIDESVKAVRTRLHHWRNSDWSTDDLRLILWIRLREAFGLAARLSVSRRGCAQLGDDLAAALIHALDPPGLVKSSKRWLTRKGRLPEGQPALTLQDVVMPVLDELVTASQSSDPDRADPGARRRVLDSAVETLRSMDEQDKQALLQATGATDLNDTALLKMLATGGGLTAFGAGVGMGGFSAYILAAKASAMVPLVSGPGLVSFVSVLSNPVTIAGATGTAIWWFGKTAQEKVRAAIAARIIAMLTIQGLRAGRQGVDTALACFPRIEFISADSGLKAKAIQHYQEERALLAPLADKRGVALQPSLQQSMNRPLSEFMAAESNPDIRPNVAREERENMGAMAAMTVGDVVYAAAAIDPAVARAADFASAADIDGRFGFARFAKQLQEGGAAESIAGSVARLKGYTAEQIVAAQLAAAGHTVEFPDASNQVGWDLLVDGQAVQVKFRQGLQGLREHFERYDYPVIANAELADKIPPEWADKVFFIDGLTEESVRHITERSVAAGADMLDSDLLPAALIIGGARAGIGYCAGKLSASQTVEQILLDGTVRMGLVGAGTLVGAGAGFALFGAAGAWIFSAGLPIIAQSQTSRVVQHIKRRIKTEAHERWQAAAHDALDRFQQTLVETLEARRRKHADDYRVTPEAGAGQYVRWRCRDDARFEHECQARLQALDRRRQPEPERRMAALLRWLGTSGIHPACYQPELHAASRQLQEKPGYLDSLGAPLAAGVEKATTAGKELFDKACSEAQQRLRTTETKAGKVNDVPDAER